jgi:putative hydrolase
MEARRKGLKEIAITDHGLNHIILGLKWWKVEQSIKEIEELRKEFSDITIYMGIEANIIGTRGIIDIKPEQLPYFDIILCGFHKPARPDRLRDYPGMYLQSYLPFHLQNKFMVRRNTKAYVEAIKNNPIDVITHINKSVKVDCGIIAEVAAECGTYIELSSRHSTLMTEDMEAMLDTDVKFIINTDAHIVKTIGVTAGAEALIAQYGIPLERIVNVGDKKPTFRSRMNK